MSTSSIIKFRNPASAFERGTRDSLLTQSLREEPLTWSYDSEYPLVLSAHGNSTSWCAFLDDHLIGHANLWPRQLQHSTDQKTIPIGLIGNVATHESYRGQGHMRSLMAQLEKIADNQGLHAVVLWSDLLQFYQNLGFTSIGREWRITIRRPDRNLSTGIKRVDLDQISSNDLSNMLAIRPKMEWDIRRSVDEFRALLGIPQTLLFVRRRGAKIVSWAVIGKGSDLQAVIHEWGALSPDEIIADIQTILAEYDASSLTLLAPTALHHHWLTPLKQRSSNAEEHHMALAMPIGTKGDFAMNSLAKCFIWGLDSI